MNVAPQSNNNQSSFSRQRRNVHTIREKFKSGHLGLLYEYYVSHIVDKIAASKNGCGASPY